MTREQRVAAWKSHQIVECDGYKVLIFQGLNLTNSTSFMLDKTCVLFIRRGQNVHKEVARVFGLIRNKRFKKYDGYLSQELKETMESLNRIIVEQGGRVNEN